MPSASEISAPSPEGRLKVTERLQNDVVDGETTLEFGPLSIINWDPDCFAKLLCNACENSRISTIDLILAEWLDSLSSSESEPFRPFGGNFNEAIEKSIANGRWDLVAHLLGKERGFRITEQVARAAIWTGSVQSLEFLLVHGWTIKNREQKPFLSSAARLDSAPLVTWLLDHGALADIRPKTVLCFSPLATAASMASMEIVQLLLRHDPDVHHDNIAIHTINSARKDREPILRYLLQQGAPVNELEHHRERSKQRFTVWRHGRVQSPLHIAVRKRKWDWDLKDSNGETPREAIRDKDYAISGVGEGQEKKFSDNLPYIVKSSL